VVEKLNGVIYTLAWCHGNEI